MTQIINFTKTKRAHKPEYAHLGDAGADLRAVEGYLMYPAEIHFFDTEIGVQIPYNCVGLIVPRSGLAKRHGISIVNTPGIIDSGYRGHIGITLVNHGPRQYEISAGDKIAQLVIVSCLPAVFFETEELGPSERGENGFGSTGR